MIIQYLTVAAQKAQNPFCLIVKYRQDIEQLDVSGIVRVLRSIFPDKTIVSVAKMILRQLDRQPSLF